MTALNDKVLVVTGAAGGIGKEVVLQARELGAKRIYSIDIKATEPVEFKGDPTIIYRNIDVHDERAVIEFVDMVRSFSNTVDHLVNCAAMMLDMDDPIKPFTEITLDEWRHMFAVNVESVFFLVKNFMPLFRNDGSIVNVTSDAIFAGYSGQLHYFASKGALDTMTRCLSSELGDRRIRVNSVAPGLTLTPPVIRNPFLRDINEKIKADRDHGDDLHPEEVASVIISLLLPYSKAITGQSIMVNKGGIKR